MLEVKIVSNSLESALKKLPEQLERELSLASRRSAISIEKGAKMKHRFTTRTGRLVKSVKGYGGAEVRQTGGFLGFFKKNSLSTEVRIVLHDEGHPLGTEYGKYVHNGQRSWKPDRFIEEAIERNKQRVQEAWQRAIEKVARGF